MDEAGEVKGAGQELTSKSKLPCMMSLKKDLIDIFKIDLVQAEILKYLDGSALIHLSGVNKAIRSIVTSSHQIKKCVNLRVSTKSLDFYTTIVEPLPSWTAQLTNLTLVCNSEVFFVSPEKWSSLTRILPVLKTLEMESSSSVNATYINKILESLSSNLKSLSLPYTFIIIPIELHKVSCQQLEELKFTTTNYVTGSRVNNLYLGQNLDFFASNCKKLKSLSCHAIEMGKNRNVQSLINPFTEGENVHLHFEGIYGIIENNCESLEKLEFGLCRQLLANVNSSSRFAKISSQLQSLKFFDLKAVTPVDEYGSYYYYHDYRNIQPPVLEILNNLPNPAQLTTLKLTLSTLPLELFKLIPQKFPQLKCLSLKAARYDGSYSFKHGDPSWSFLQLLTELEELEITRIIIYEESMSDFGLEISKEFHHLIQNSNLRKLSLRGMNSFDFEYSTSSAFFIGILKMRKLKELALTGYLLYLGDFVKICTLKHLEKLEISYFYPFTNPAENSRPRTTTNMKIYYRKFQKAFSTLKCLKELSIELWCSDFAKVFKSSISFPSLKSLILVDKVNVPTIAEQVNFINLNPMLKKLRIVIGVSNAGATTFEGTWEERPNLKIDFGCKQIPKSGFSQIPNFSRCESIEESIENSSDSDHQNESSDYDDDDSN